MSIISEALEKNREEGEGSELSAEASRALPSESQPVRTSQLIQRSGVEIEQPRRKAPPARSGPGLLVLGLGAALFLAMGAILAGVFLIDLDQVNGTSRIENGTSTISGNNPPPGARHVAAFVATPAASTPEPTPAQTPETPEPIDTPVPEATPAPEPTPVTVRVEVAVTQDREVRPSGPRDLYEIPDEPASYAEPAHYDEPRKTTRSASSGSSGLDLGQFRLDGILWAKNSPSVMINDEILEVGDSVEGARITAIGKTSVTLEYQGKKYTLN